MTRKLTIIAALAAAVTAPALACTSPASPSVHNAIAPFSLNPVWPTSGKVPPGTNWGKVYRGISPLKTARISPMSSGPMSPMSTGPMSPMSTGPISPISRRISPLGGGHLPGPWAKLIHANPAGLGSPLQGVSWHKIDRSVSPSKFSPLSSSPITLHLPLAGGDPWAKWIHTAQPLGVGSPPGCHDVCMIKPHVPRPNGVRATHSFGINLNLGASAGFNATIGQ